jgi:hypothetical protein
MIRLDPPIPVRTPLGDGHAYFVSNPGKGHHLEWTVAQDETGEFWTFPNPQVRRQTSISDGWLNVSPWREEDKEAFPWSPEFQE